MNITSTTANTFSPNVAPRQRLPGVSAEIDAKVRPLARQFVAQTFYLPMLKQVRDSSLQTDTSKMLTGGRGGEAFGSMLDQMRADHMSKSTDGKLVDAMVKKIAKSMS